MGDIVERTNGLSNSLFSDQQAYIAQFKHLHTWIARRISVGEGYTNVLDEADVLRSDIRQETTNVGPTKLFPEWIKVLSSLVSIVTE